jgi:hypothetical protein
MELSKWLLKSEAKQEPIFDSQDPTHESSDVEKVETEIVELK